MFGQIARTDHATQNGHWEKGGLVLAQHHGLATRLLDWTSNPLAALWFGCASQEEGDSFVYTLNATDLLIPPESGKSPFDQSKTRVFQPRLNNARIVAQHGWFTAHRYSEGSGWFVKLEKNPDINKHLSEIIIPKKLRKTFIRSLDRHGTSYRTLFPDLQGLCRYVNWHRGIE